MRLANLAVLHKKVVRGRMGHSDHCVALCNKHPETPTPIYSTRKCEVCREEVEVRKWSSNALGEVCADCFGSDTPMYGEDE
jgi:hypothetical protein